MRTLWTLIVLHLVLLPAQAQVTPPAPGTSTTSSALPPQVSSLTLGRMGVDFEYVDSTRQHYYVFDGSTTALRLSSDDASLTFMYGQQAADTSIGYPTFNMIGVGLQFGGNNYFVRDTNEQPFAFYVPVRMDLSYMNLAKDGDGPAVRSDLPHLHFFRGALSAGLAGRFRLTQAVPVLQDRLVVQAHLLKGVGAATNAAQSPIRLGLSQLSEFHLEVRLEHIANSNLGATVGYTRQSRGWSNEAPGSVYDVLSAVFDGDGLGQSSSQGMLHIGVNWQVNSQP